MCACENGCKSDMKKMNLKITIILQKMKKLKVMGLLTFRYKLTGITKSFKKPSIPSVEIQKRKTIRYI